jgi:hypothetical protein
MKTTLSTRIKNTDLPSRPVEVCSDVPFSHQTSHHTAFCHALAHIADCNTGVPDGFFPIFCFISFPENTSNTHSSNMGSAV